tara:strand:+ start:71 stop:949 length:879 start_codon:yes stop_codon:yes gene_type:complete
LLKEKIIKLSDSLINYGEIINVSELSGGFSTDVFLLELTKSENISKLVLRMEAGLPSENSAKTEYKLLECLKETTIPSAVPVYLDSSGSHLGRPFFISSYIEGTQNLGSKDDAFFIETIANQLKDIHMVNTDNLPKLPLRVDPLEGLLDYLPKKDNWIEIREYIKELSFEKYNADFKLLHGDFWPGNLLWKSDNIVGVVDWDYAAIGDPLYDLAVSCLMFRYLYGRQDMESFKVAYIDQSEFDEKRFLLWSINIASSTLYFINEWRLTNEDKDKMIDAAKLIISESYDQIRN